MKKYLCLLFLNVFSIAVFASPPTLTYQGRILKADGTPLEFYNVSFIFQIVDPSGACVLYQEQVNGYDMTNSSGVFDTAIGSGSRQFPSAGVFTILDSLNNSGTLSCQGGSTYSPLVTDGRFLRVQFFDGVGWKTVTPDNIIRSVPYAGYAASAQKLGMNSAADFVLKAGLPTCTTGTFLSWDGSTLSCAAGGGGGGGGSVTNITASSPLMVSNGSTTPALTITQATNSTNGYLSSVDWNSFNNKLGSTTAFVGDVSGTFAATSVDKLKGIALNMTGIAAGKVLTYDGTNWVPSAASTGTVTAVSSANSYLTVTSGSSAPLLTLNVGNSANTVAAGNDGRIVNAIQNAGNTLSIQSGLDTNLPAPASAGKIYIATDAQKIYRDNGSAWVVIGSAGGSGGTVTSVSSTNADINVTNGSTIPSLTLNSGTGPNQILKLDGSAKIPAVDGSQVTALNPANLSTTVPVNKGGTGQTTYADGQILIGNSTGNTLSKQILSGDVTMTNAGVVTVTGVKGKAVTAAPTAAGQVLRYDGASWTPTFVSMFDLRSTLTGAATFGGGAAGCTAAQTLTWTSATDNLACTNIAIANSQITYASQTANTFFAAPSSGAGAPSYRGIVAADLPTSVTDGLWTAASGNVYRNSGNVGIGTNAPGYLLDVNGSARFTQVCIGTDCRAAWPTGGGGGSVVSVSSANADISIANGTTTPTLTLNSGTGASQILKLDGSAKIPAVDGSQITNLNPTNLSAVVPVSKGGTGQSSYTDGQLLIGNSTGNTLSKAALSAGTGISITNGNGSITIASTVSTAGLQSSSLADGNIWVGQSGVAAAVAPSGDIAMTNAGVMTVTGVKGKSITAAPTATGQVLRYNGTAWAPNFVGMQDLRSNVTGTTQLAATCGANQTLTYNAASDNLTCTNIAIANSQITYASQTANTFFAAPSSGAGAPGYRGIVAADLPTSVTDGLWTAASGNVYRNSGNVGIGTNAPGYLLDVNGSARFTQVCIGTDCRAAWPTGGGGGSVVSVSSANADISIANGTTTPTLTLNSGTGASQILKLDGSAKIPAVDGSQITNLNPTNLSAVVPVAKGGTGQSSFTDGQLLIGNSTGNTLSKAALSAGAGISITNGNGSIMIATSTIPGAQVSGNIAGNAAGFTGNLAGDVTGTQSATKVVALQNYPVATTTPGTNQVLEWNGSAWTPTALPAGNPGTVTSVGVAVPGYMTSSGGPVTSSGNITLGFGAQSAKNVFAAPNGGSGAPGFRTLNISDIQSSVSGNFLATSGACAAGQTLTYVSASDSLSCQAYSITSAQVTAAMGYTPANGSNYLLKSGDTMTGQLGLSSSGIQGVQKDNISTRTDSGFWQTSAASTANGWPTNSGGWFEMISATHTNGGNYYGMQIAGDYGNQNEVYYRTMNGNGAAGWSKLWHSGNLTNLNQLANGPGYITGESDTLASVTARGATTDSAVHFRSNKGSSSYLGGNSTYSLEAYSDDGGAAAMSFHRGGNYAVNFGLDPDNVMRIGGWSASANRWQLDMNGNETLAGQSTATQFNGSGAGLTGTAGSLTAGAANYVAWGNVGGKPFNWSGQGGQPSWVWGSNDGNSYYVWNPSNFSVNYATTANYANSTNYANSAGSATNATNATNATYTTYVNDDSYNMKFHWSGQGGQPTWLWGSNDGQNAYIWNPSNFSVNYANTANYSNSTNYANSAGSANYVAATNVGGTFGYINVAGGGTWAMNAEAVNGVLGKADDGGSSGIMGQNTATGSAGNLGYAGWGVYCNHGTCGGQAGWTTTSDRRLKKDIKPIDHALDKIMRLEGVTYHWKNPKDDKAQGEKVGLIAQDVEAVFPQAVVTDNDSPGHQPGGTKMVTYTELVGPVIQAIKELAQKVFTHHEEITAIKRELASVQEKAAQAEKQNIEMKKYLCQKDPQAPFCH